MSKVTVAVLVGSLRRESINQRLALAVERLAPDGFGFEHVRIDNLPLYNQDFDGNYPAEGRRLKQQIEAADALLFVTPEYNRSIPGVLKNALDMASRPGARTRLPANRAVWSAPPSAPPARRWRNSICAMCWPTSMCRHSRSRRCSSTSRTTR